MKPAKKIGLICFALLLTVQLSTAAQEDIVEKSFKVKPGGTLILDTDIGSVEVNTEAKDEVFVQIQYSLKSWGSGSLEATLDKYDLVFNQNGNDVQILNKYKDSDNWRKHIKNFQVTFIISVPHAYHLELKTSGGSISVNDLDGTIKAKTSGGSIKFGAISGAINASTSGGSIKVEKCGASVDVHTSGGSIKMGEINGDVAAHTSGGNISLGSIDGSVVAKTSGGSIWVEDLKKSVLAETSGGSVTASISEQPEGDCRLTTSGGNVHVTLAEKINLNLDASTSGGSIHTDFPVKIQGKLSTKHIQAEINDGGPLLYLRTSGGSVFVNKM